MPIRVGRPAPGLGAGWRHRSVVVVIAAAAAARRRPPQPPPRRSLAAALQRQLGARPGQVAPLVTRGGQRRCSHTKAPVGYHSQGTDTLRKGSGRLRAAPSDWETNRGTTDAQPVIWFDKCRFGRGLNQRRAEPAGGA